ncbi:unnamed protein product [Arabis nemorensis]|uniref:DUF4283 domain-containing protein n=1 Tax=Arabis nemorensis TaxID=586526 RepID=A0A565B9Q9_9BRAS|nr:unnamed protein product [Arabis nemorensis]
MAFFGKLLAPETEGQRPKPLQLPPVNMDRVLKKFENTLVGRVLNPEISEARVKVMLAFLPSVWKCEGKAQGLEMGRGSFQIRFEEESTLHLVLDNRPYHFDGWMIALERWKPTVRKDFPNTIPFWIKIMDLPPYLCEDDQVKRIGEDLGDLKSWKASAPFPLIRLQNHCKRCLRMTHETRSCPNRGMRLRHPPKQQPQREAEEDRKRQRATRGDYPKAKENRADGRTKPRDRASVIIAEPKPLQRDLMLELTEAGDRRFEKRASTSEWVRKAFGRNTDRQQDKEGRHHSSQQIAPSESAPDEARPFWYPATEEDAAIARAVLVQNRKWDQLAEELPA